MHKNSLIPYIKYQNWIMRAQNRYEIIYFSKLSDPKL